jgi:hypothetical protein
MRDDEMMSRQKDDDRMRGDLFIPPTVDELGQAGNNTTHPRWHARVPYPYHLMDMFMSTPNSYTVSYLVSSFTNAAEVRP